MSNSTLPVTLDDLHNAGCVPLIHLQPGHNTMAWNGDPAACEGQTATLVYDIPGHLTTRLVDLANPSLHIDVPCGHTDVQVDLFVGDVTNPIHIETEGGPAFNPAHKLITVSWLDGPQCAPPTPVTTYLTTPMPTVPELVDDPLLPPATVLEPPATTTTTVVEVPAGPAPQLPETGAEITVPAVGGLSLILAGAALLARYRNR